MARSLGALIRERRKELGLSQVELAERLVHVPGMAQNHLSLFEADRRPLNVCQLGALVEVLELDPEATRDALLVAAAEG